MGRCSVLHCRSDSDRKLPDISFHSFPEDPYLRQKWIDSIGRKNWTPRKSSRICSRHFDHHELIKKKKITLLLPNSVPSQVRADSPVRQDHDYHLPIFTSHQATVPAPSVGPMEQYDRLTQVLPESKDIIFNVYHFLHNEYQRLKQLTGDSCDLSSLAHTLGRTAEATGVSQQTVFRILRDRKLSRDGTGDGGETKRVRLSQNESVPRLGGNATHSPIEDDSSSCTDSADEIGDTIEDEDNIGTLNLKFEVDEEYTDAGRKRLVMTIDPLAAQPTTISSPEYMKMEEEFELKMEPEDMEYIQSTSSVRELSPTHPEVKLEPSDTQYQQPTSPAHHELSPTHPGVKLEPSDVQSLHEHPSCRLDNSPVYGEGDPLSGGTVLTISNHRRKKS